MTSSKSTKRALFTSALAILMCVAMLVGATFAWFTDTASTGVNKIQAGNLHVEIQDKEGTEIDTLKWVDKNGNEIANQDDILWEPGCTYLLTPFKIANTGNLALKYKIVITGLDGDSPLLDVIKFTYKVGDVESLLNEEGHLTPKGTDGATTDMITVSAHMDETAGNDYMGKTLTGVKFTVVATQYNYESDSFGPDYDKFADYPEVQPVATLEQLQEVLTSDDINGKTIKLYDNLDNVTNLRISNKDIALDLNGKSMKTEHLQVNGSKIVIKDTSEGRNGKIETTDSYAVVQAENSDVTIESGKFISSYNRDGGSGYAPVISVRNSDLTINGGYFENANDVGSYNYLIKAPSYNRTEKTTITINGGEFVSHRNYGGIVTGDSDANVDVVINGGTFTTEGNNSYLTNVKGNVVVNDCTFTAGNSVVFNIPKGYTATVKGGTFSVNNKSGFFSHNKTTGWVSDFTGTLLVDPIKPVKINQETYSGFFANGATQSAKGADGFYTISK